MRRTKRYDLIRIFSFLMVSLLPSWTVLFNVVELSSLVPGKWFGGDAFFLVREKSDFQYFTDGQRELSYIPSKNLLLGVLPLEATRPVAFYGWRKTKSQPWSAPRFDWFVRFFDIQRNPQDPVNLRFPSNVWEKVSTNDAERARDRAVMANLYSRNDGELNMTCMASPMKSKSVSLYGSPRQLPDGHRYHHTGEDLRASTGTPIFAAGPGEVEFSGEMIVPGRNVILYHGAGLHSRYLHMSQPEVVAGTSVARGQRIGLSGGTGRVTAPHLHWEIVWKGLPANPQKFMHAWRKICSE